MSFDAIDAAWWSILFILIGGWLATDIWRWLGVLLGNRINEESQALVLVRAIATALVAGVIAKLVVFPSGSLAETHWALRVGALAFGFLAFQLAKQNVMVGVVSGALALFAAIAVF
ncbi:MAG: AzlD domain-containing protein [Pseudomonadota bacterium]